MPRRVRCHECGYHYERAHMVMLVPSGRYRCTDRAACAGRIKTRERLDAWKGGQRVGR